MQPLEEQTSRRTFSRLQMTDEHDVVHKRMQEVGYGEFMSKVARCTGHLAHTELETQDELVRVFTADAWDECYFKWSQFLLSYIYEVLPSLVSQFLCTAIEGSSSTRNRYLFYPRGFLHDMIFRSNWICVMLFIFFAPPCVSGLELVLIWIMLSFRGACIAMKYAYLSLTDIRIVQGALQWEKGDHVSRILGGAIHFNFAGTYYFDILKEILVSALRAGVLGEIRKRKFRLPPSVAKAVWDQVKEKLLSIDDMSLTNASATLGAGVSNATDIRASKFGDVQALVGLSDLDKVDAEVSEGQLRACVVIYYFATRSYAPSSFRWQLIISISISVGICSSGFRFYVQDFSEANVYTYVILAGWLVSFIGGICIYGMYLTYCVLDAWKRNRLTRSFLASLGHQQVRGRRLFAGYEDIDLPLNTVEDLFAAWVVQRVLGPELARGLSVRYNNAYLTVAVVHLVAMCAAFAFIDIGGDDILVEWALAITVFIPFLITLIGVCTATLIQERSNNESDLVQKVLKRAALNAELNKSSVSREIGETVELLNANLGDVEPVQILYMPATSEVLSAIWAVLTVMSSVMQSQLCKRLTKTEAID